ncbi:MAG: hypothetical protein AABZ57_08305 [Candidatus Margulisiibacteriota bacterium]
MRIKYKHVCLWVFLFSISVISLGCVPEDKTEAYKLYSANCGSCHRLLPPEEHSIEKFKEYIEKYGKGMSAEEKTVLLDGLRKHKELKENTK